MRIETLRVLLLTGAAVLAVTIGSISAEGTRNYDTAVVCKAFSLLANNSSDEKGKSAIARLDAEIERDSAETGRTREQADADVEYSRYDWADSHERPKLLQRRMDEMFGNLVELTSAVTVNPSCWTAAQVESSVANLISHPPARTPGSGNDVRTPMLARIYRPAKSAMQSGMARTKEWVLEFEGEQAKDIEPLMGWTSSTDTKDQLHLSFDSKEEAMAFAERHAIPYQVFEPKPRRATIKAYADNFKFNRKGLWTH